jgi:hypothetical protein
MPATRAPRPAIWRMRLRCLAEANDVFFTWRFGPATVHFLCFERVHSACIINNLDILRITVLEVWLGLLQGSALRCRDRRREQSCLTMSSPG